LGVAIKADGWFAGRGGIGCKGGIASGSGGLDLDQILKDIEEAAAFQLGRCIMLVETYREMSWEEDGSMKRVFRKINKRLSRLF